MMKWCGIIFTLFLGSTWAATSFNSMNRNENFICPDLLSQDSLGFQEIMGKWYVVEILEHLQKQSPLENDYRVVVTNHCPIVRLQSPEPGSLKLFWSEKAGDIVYNFQVQNQRKGAWYTNTRQNGTLVDIHYAQFYGRAFVMKAVATHMVLTFCSSSNEQHPGLLYSLLLSREHILKRSEINGVHKLMARRNLYISLIKESCAHGAANIKASSLSLGWLILLGILTTSGLHSGSIWQ
ncbi:uncharacterized protein LOC117174807 [Belonocnema kinseyi]|uniref:uncharacterized protein LOC117174807 n=1 Tax=Belonocnema kinseyi TaxID=2817044 RepID=UPI00143D7AD7|nr:uncharacterized protein LOC117174807 [Belonocnema kinseyi]